MRRLRLPGLVLLPLAAALQSLTPRSVAERYAHLLYPRVAHFLSAINHHFSFSLAELVVGALLLAGIAAILWAAWPRPGVLRRLAGVLSAALATGGYLLLAFSLLWGLNYRRPPLAERLGIPTGGSSGDLAATAVWLAEATRRESPPAPGDDPTGLPFPERELDTRIEEGYARAGELRTGITRPLGPAKPVLCSSVLSHLGLSGIFSPFTGEPNFNRMLPDSELVFAMAHEKAHQRGIAPENEANFAAFLALRAAPDRYLRYCANLGAVTYLLRPLAEADTPGYHRVWRLLQGRPAADLARERAFWARYRGPAQRASHRVNDLYLRANQVPGGIRSYGAVTDLLVGYHRSRPALRPAGALGR